MTVESLNQRETYFARVTGPQTCDVLAHAMTASEDVAVRPANADRLLAAKSRGGQRANGRAGEQYYHHH